MDSTRSIGAGAMSRPNPRDANRFVARVLASALVLAVLLLAAPQIGSAQAGPHERNYPQSKSAVERALKQLQPSLSGRLPVLEGFTLPGDHPLDRYRRAFY